MLIEERPDAEVSLPLEPETVWRPEQPERDHAGNEPKHPSPGRKGRPLVLSIRFEKQNPPRNFAVSVAGQSLTTCGFLFNEIAAEQPPLFDHLANGQILRPRPSVLKFIAADLPGGQMPEQFGELIAGGSIDHD